MYLTEGNPADRHPGIRAEDIPQITVFDVRSLFASEAEQPVLYIEQGESDGVSMSLEVWASAYVHHAAVVLTRENAEDLFGDDCDDDTIREYLSELQEDVNEMVVSLAERI